MEKSLTSLANNFSLVTYSLALGAIVIRTFWGSALAAIDRSSSVGLKYLRKNSSRSDSLLPLRTDSVHLPILEESTLI